MTPTSRSLKLLRSWPAFHADVVERWVRLPDGRDFRRDLFGGFDLMAVDVVNRCVWLIQTTSMSNVSSRVAKLRGLSVVADLIKAGIVCEVWGWAQRTEGGRWYVKRVRLEGDDIEPVDVQPKRRRVVRMKQPALFE